MASDGTRNGTLLPMPKLRGLLAGALICGLGSLAPGAAHATVVKALTLYEKAQVAAVVVHATVERAEPAWEIEGGSVKTLVTLKVIASLKGGARPGDRLIVRQSGGKIGDFEHHIPGVSTWEPGEEVIMFLEPLGPYLVEIGIGIGKYEIETDGAKKWVTHDPKVALARIEPGKGMVIEESGPMVPELLPDFLKRVRTYVAGIQTPAGAAKKEPKLKELPALPVEGR